MTRSEALTALAQAEADLAAARRDIEEAAAKTGYVERTHALELAARLEDANARIFHLRGEVKKLSD